MNEREEKRVWRRTRTAVTFLLLLCIGVGVGLLFTPVFHVQEVYCEGNDRIPQEEIIAAAEVQTGKNILSQRLTEIKKRVEQVPMVEEVKVRRVFPNKVKIWIRERIPAAYIYTDGQAVMIDVEGKILEIINDERVGQLLAAYKPVKIEKEEKKEEQETKPEATATPEPTKTPEPTETSEPEIMEILPPEGMYSVPVVVGIELEKPQVGKVAQSKEREKLSQMMATFRALDAAELLVRATYMDVTNPADVILMIENRLEVQLGNLDNIDYRCQFLGTVIQGKIGAAEVAIIEYRGKDLYVRPPEDGKDRMIPKPTEKPDPEESDKPDKDEE